MDPAMHQRTVIGGVGFLKGGIPFADKITTVSPTYAREILTPEFGMALDGLLRVRASVVEGIVNGIDDSVWNPATDPLIPAHYSVDDLIGKQEVVIKSLGEGMGQVPGVAGGAILGDGRVGLILDMGGLWGAHANA